MQSSDRFIVALQNKEKNLYMENTATFDPSSPQTGSLKPISQLGPHLVMKETRVTSISCHCLSPF